MPRKNRRGSQFKKKEEKTQTKTTKNEPFTMDSEDRHYMKKVIREHFLFLRNFNKSTSAYQNNCPEREILFRNITDHGIDEEDMKYLKICFDELQSFDVHCLDCALLKNTTPTEQDASEDILGIGKEAFLRELGLVRISSIRPKPNDEDPTNEETQDQRCWFHRLKWVPHVTTAEDTNYDSTDPPSLGGCARTRDYIENAPQKNKNNPKELCFENSKKRKHERQQSETCSKTTRSHQESKESTENKENESESEEFDMDNPYRKTFMEKQLTSCKTTLSQNRRLPSFSSDLIHTTLDIKQQRKRLTVRRSKIHGLGVFATQPIRMHQIIIEYVGEIVRPIVADLREKKYKQVYCFSLNDEIIIDATKFGNIGRFINHSCMPNSYAKPLEKRNRKRIVICAKRDILANEEITYDYNLSTGSEKYKVICLCGASNCKGILN